MSRFAIKFLPTVIAVSAAACSCNEDTDPTGGAGGTFPQTGATSNVSTTIASSSSGDTCAAPLADCDGEASNGCEVDTSTDALHCGGCTNPCNVGSCVAGQCQTAEVLTSGLPSVLGIAHDDTRIYFASGGRLAMSFADGGVYSIPVDGASTPTTLVAPVTAAEQVLLDGDDVIFTSHGSEGGNFLDGYLGRVPKAGGASEVLANQQAYAQDAILHDGSYFVVCAGTYSADFLDGEIRQWSAGVDSLVAGPYPSPEAIAVEGDFLYWITATPDSPIADGAIHRKPLAGGPVETLVEGLERPSAMLSTGGKVYVAYGEAIFRFDPATPEQQEEFVNEGRIVGRMAADATDLYWVEPGGRVARKALGGGPTIVLADGLNQPSSITLGDAYAYFTDAGTGGPDGAVLRIHK